MSKKKTYKSKTTPPEVSEPVATYETKRLHFFNSFEEMEEADARQMASINPLDHLKNVTELIKRIYAKELKKKMTDFKIHYK